MYKCRLTYDEWNCIVSKEVNGKRINRDRFKGYIGITEIHKVTCPQIWNYTDQPVTVCDNGMKWLSILPENECYCITAMMNADYDVQVWYIDIIASQGIDSDGIPYVYDLYLDLVVYPAGDIITDDLNELESALLEKEITKSHYDLAMNTSRYLNETLLSDLSHIKEYTKQCLKLFNSESA